MKGEIVSGSLFDGVHIAHACKHNDPRDIHGTNRLSVESTVIELSQVVGVGFNGLVTVRNGEVVNIQLG